MGKNQHVVPVGDKWGIKGEGNSRLTSHSIGSLTQLPLLAKFPGISIPSCSFMVAMVKFEKEIPMETIHFLQEVESLSILSA